jgi:hypothetical protein
MMKISFIVGVAILLGCIYSLGNVVLISNQKICTHIFRFRMTKQMFHDIASAEERHDEYFVQKYNAAHKLGFSHLQKATNALRMLAYGGPGDSFDEYLHMAESTILESVRHFIRSIVEIYGPRYLRPPNEEEVATLLQIAEARGFPGMLGIIDCMH